MNQKMDEELSFYRFLGNEKVDLCASLLRSIRKLEADGNPWVTDLDGPPNIGIEPWEVAGKTILSIGSFEGNFEWRLAQAGAARVVGIEGDAGNYAKCCVLARAYPELQIEFLHTDIVDYQIPHGEFDIVYCLGIIYHLENPHEHLKALRDSGAKQIYITTQLATDPPHPSTEKFRLGPREAVFLDDKPYYGKRFTESYIDGRDNLSSFWFYSEELRRLSVDLGLEISHWAPLEYGEGGHAISAKLGRLDAKKIGLS